MKNLLKWRTAFFTVVLLAYLGSMAEATYSGYKYPWYNWDMFGYVGAVTEWQEKDPTVLHSKTLVSVCADVGRWLCSQFLHTQVSSESKAFNEQLPNYRIKPFYNAGVWLVHQAGIPLSSATALVSDMAFGALALMLLVWKPHCMAREAWLISVIAITHLFPLCMATLPHMSTPDSLYTVLAIAMLYSWLELKSFALFAMFALLGEYTRPEAFILSSLCALYFACIPAKEERMVKWLVAALITILVASYFGINHFAKSYSWEQWFTFAFLYSTPYPAEIHTHITLKDYWAVLFGSTRIFLHNPRTYTMINWSLIAGIFHVVKPTEHNLKNAHILLITWACLIFRFMVFPAYGEDRYYFVYFIIMLYTGGEMMAPLLSAQFGRLALLWHKNSKALT